MPNNYDKKLLSKLIKKAQQGDNSSFARVYDLFVNDIFRYAMSIVRNVELAQDITSETFMRAWKHLPGFKNTNFRAFLYTIARNFSYDLIKKESKVQSLNDKNLRVSKQDKTLRDIIKREANIELAQAMQKLPKQYQEILTLRFLQELSIKEACEILSKSESAVKVSQHRALKKLQTILYE